MQLLGPNLLIEALKQLPTFDSSFFLYLFSAVSKRLTNSAGFFSLLPSISTANGIQHPVHFFPPFELYTSKEEMVVVVVVVEVDASKGEGAHQNNPNLPLPLHPFPNRRPAAPMFTSLCRRGKKGAERKHPARHPGMRQRKFRPADARALFDP